MKLAVDDGLGVEESTRGFLAFPQLPCVLRVARPHDLDSTDAFVIPVPGGAEKRPEFSRSMRVCVSARMSAADEVRSYRAWLGGFKQAELDEGLRSDGLTIDETERGDLIATTLADPNQVGGS